MRVEFLTVQHTPNGITQENVHQLLVQSGNAECTMITNSVSALLTAYTLQN
jgi:hypothetical protein